jgi:starch-binding outer membrane protein, SusD/RagB family
MNMKLINIKTIIGSALMIWFLGGCSGILDEKPRSIYEPGYFKTEKGVMGGLNSMYAHLRFIYGNGYYYTSTQSGTDEGTWGQNVNADSKNSDFSGVGALTPTNNPTAAIWGVFPNINTASGIIENAEAVGTVSAALIAEARFFRAFDYFLLVQTYGGVPLDLGAGELKFNTSTVRTSVRNTVPEVYTKAIFPDLIKAVNDLPDAPRLPGAVTKTVARLFLAKAYLTYGWWLQNPNSIPTYPETPRTDPDSKTAQWYFQQAYDVALQGIDNAGANYALQATYYDVNLGSNDRNKECMLFADHTEKSDLYNGAVVTGFAPGDVGGNITPWFTTWNYTDLRSSSSNTSWSGVASVQREATQPHGRPWTAVAPTHGAIINIFADKTNDSRYDGTFTTVYRGNWTRNPNDAHRTVLYNANNLPVLPGEPILTFLNSDPGSVVYPSGAGNNNIGAGVMPGRADWVVTPAGISRIVYPGLWKMGPYRTDNGTGLGQMNVSSTRPFVIAKFSELYFIAAEAVVKGATPTAGRGARELINVIRARAGKWRWDNGGNVSKVQDNSAVMTAATPATLTIDYILDERTREYFGEGYRWFDLVRTQTWHTRASSYTICGTAKGDHNPVTYNRTIDLKHYLRPIPQSQIDGMEMTADEKAKYQNPGY